MSKDQKFPGGLLVGETDKNGGKGIKVVAPEGNIIVGGGELVLTSDTGKSQVKHEFDGKEMTPCEIASHLNVEGGGVKIPCHIAEPANTTDSKMEVGDVIRKAETGTVVANTDDVNFSELTNAVSKYGWTVKVNKQGKEYELINRKNVPVADVKIKGSKYYIFDKAGNKLLAGNNQPWMGAERVATKYFYASPVAEHGAHIPTESTEDKIKRLKSDLLALEVRGEGNTAQANVIRGKIAQAKKESQSQFEKGGDVKKIIRRNLPINKEYKLIDSFYTGGLIENPMVCDNCNKPIANVAVIEDEDGKKFHVGMDCAETLSSIKNSMQFNQASHDFSEANAIRAKVRNARKKDPNAKLRVENTDFGTIYVSMENEHGRLYFGGAHPKEFFMKHLPDLAKHISNPEKNQFMPRFLENHDFGIDLAYFKKEAVGKTLELPNYKGPREFAVDGYRAVISYGPVSFTKSDGTIGYNNSYSANVYKGDALIGKRDFYMYRDIPSTIRYIINEYEFNNFQPSTSVGMRKGGEIGSGVGYHVTEYKNLPDIKKFGIKARTGKTYRHGKEVDIPNNVYVWKEKKYADWFKGVKEDDGQKMVLLTVNLNGLKLTKDPETNDMSQWSSLFKEGEDGQAYIHKGTIDPDRIIGIQADNGGSMEAGGKTEEKFTSFAPEGTVFVKIGSHRAYDRVQRTGIPQISLWNMYVNGSAGQSLHLINEKDYEKIKNIKGISKPMTQIKSPGQIWRPIIPKSGFHSDANTENRKLHDAYERVNSPKMAVGGFIREGDFYVASYKFNPSLRTWRRGYIKPVWSEKTTIPVVLRYDLYDKDKKEIVKRMTPGEAEKFLAEDKIVAGDNKPFKPSFEAGGIIKSEDLSDMLWVLQNEGPKELRNRTNVAIADELVSRGLAEKISDKSNEYAITKRGEMELMEKGGKISKESIREGTKVELEHKDTIRKIKDNPNITVEKAAEMIATDHLHESPLYYKKLKSMERSM